SRRSIPASVHQFAQKSPVIVTGASLHMPTKFREADCVCENAGMDTYAIRTSTPPRALRMRSIAMMFLLILLTQNNRRSHGSLASANNRSRQRTNPQDPQEDGHRP